MSVPARSVARVKPKPKPQHRPRRQAHRPSLRVVRAPRRRSLPIGFLVLSGSMVAAMFLGLVSLNALVSEGSFRIDDLKGRVDHLAVRHDVLQKDVAEMSAPGRIADWARQHGMRLPDVPVILHVPGPDRATPAGVADATSGSNPTGARVGR